MRKIIKISTIAVVCFFATTIHSCKKPEKGEKGDTGPQGNANVINYSFTAYSWDWTYDSLYKRWYHRYYLNVDSESAVLTYVMSGRGKQAIPYYEHDPSPIQFDAATHLWSSPSYIEFQFTNYNSLTTSPASDNFFYIVVIPTRVMNSHPNVNWKNYEEVKSLFHLK